MGNLGIGALMIVALIAAIAVVINAARIDNKLLRQRDSWQNSTKWNWD